MRISPTTALLLVLKKCPEKSKLISTLLFNGRDDKNCDQFDSTLNNLASLYPDSHYEILTLRTGHKHFNRLSSSKAI
ncbi:hypothetical protein K661_02300 [Piscirickettsia salmonis LF-89 = ATCC VR-1361]|nr:hypothetical protein K661_02300 [Piscirickettsia salmonis LF-89 = ATCC VR-1361]